MNSLISLEGLSWVKYAKFYANGEQFDTPLTIDLKYAQAFYGEDKLSIVINKIIFFDFGNTDALNNFVEFTSKAYSKYKSSIDFVVQVEEPVSLNVYETPLSGDELKSVLENVEEKTMENNTSQFSWSPEETIVEAMGNEQRQFPRFIANTHILFDEIDIYHADTGEEIEKSKIFWVDLENGVLCRLEDDDTDFQFATKICGPWRARWSSIIYNELVVKTNWKDLESWEFDFRAKTKEQAYVNKIVEKDLKDLFLEYSVASTINTSYQRDICKKIVTYLFEKTLMSKDEIKNCMFTETISEMNSDDCDVFIYEIRDHFVEKGFRF